MPGGRKAEGGVEVPLLGSRSGSGVSGEVCGGGGDPLAVTPPPSLAALWRFC